MWFVTQQVPNRYEKFKVAPEYDLIFPWVLFTDRDVALKRNIGNILDLVSGPTGSHPKTIASVNAAFDHINKLGREFGTR